MKTPLHAARIAFADRTAAEVRLAAEPFTRAGLYTRRETHAFADLWPLRAGSAPATDAALDSP